VNAAECNKEMIKVVSGSKDAMSLMEFEVLNFAY
jgi:hypothetical protein